jgi:hypothetical protein
MAEPSTNKKLNLRRLMEEIEEEDCIDQERKPSSKSLASKDSSVYGRILDKQG